VNVDRMRVLGEVVDLPNLTLLSAEGYHAAARCSSSHSSRRPLMRWTRCLSPRGGRDTVPTPVPRSPAAVDGIDSRMTRWRGEPVARPGCTFCPQDDAAGSTQRSTHGKL
jgi:hypothetical protein